MVLPNYQNFIKMTSYMFYIVALGVDLKCPHKIHLNTQCPSPSDCQTFQRPSIFSLFSNICKVKVLLDHCKEKGCKLKVMYRHRNITYLLKACKWYPNSQGFTVISKKYRYCQKKLFPCFCI